MTHSRRTFAKTTLLVASSVVTMTSGLLARTGTTTHTVSKGDTLSRLARKYNTTVRAIQQTNGLQGDLIRIGQKLLIPASGGSTAQTDLLRNVRAINAGIPVRPKLWNTIVVHHSAVKFGNAAKYDAGHRRRGMKNGLAYHFVIGNGIDSGDGEIEIGPRWRKQLLGGHLKSYRLNQSAIGICLVGNFEETRPSKKQIQALTQLVDWLQREVLRKRTRFAGHKELPGEKTVCPGKYFPLKPLHRRYG
ncbi:MAG: LysM peptidoglycan-binding domain-containing protein [Coraliomargarita sp. TMED73]|nr:MAG: LysM peptidoglycan-binding domain-containing protein [Coraliomargarita sp. TMED73]